MKLSHLLQQRDLLLQQAQRANLAYAHSQLASFSARIARAGLRGRVTLRHPAPDEERFWASLTALDGNQSVIEEHFTDADVMDLADVLAFLAGQNRAELTFHLEEFTSRFVLPLRRQLERAGVQIDETANPANGKTPPSDGPSPNLSHLQEQDDA
jgi:hypothetical protein